MAARKRAAAARRVAGGPVVWVACAVIGARRSGPATAGEERPRARDGSGGGVAVRLAADGGGLGRGRLGVGLPGGAGAAGVELVEQQAAVDRDLAPGLQIVGAGMRLAFEALDVEVAVVALLAGALDGDPQGADRGAAVGLQELRVLGEVAGAGPAVHEVLLRPAVGGLVTDEAEHGARRAKRTRRAAPGRAAEPERSERLARRPAGANTSPPAVALARQDRRSAVSGDRRRPPRPPQSSRTNQRPLTPAAPSAPGATTACRRSEDSDAHMPLPKRGPHLRNRFPSPSPRGRRPRRLGSLRAAARAVRRPERLGRAAPAGAGRSPSPSG